MQKIANVLLANNLSIPTADNVTIVYTTSANIKFTKDTGLWLKFSSSGTVNVRIRLEESYTTPTTQGAQDNNYVIPDGYADIGTFTNTNAHILPVSTVIMQHLRFQLIGLTGNSASTTVTLYLARQEPGRTYGS